MQLTSQRADLNEITTYKEFLQVNKKYQLSHSKPPEKIPRKDMQMNISLLREMQTEKHPEAFLLSPNKSAEIKKFDPTERVALPTDFLRFAEPPGSLSPATAVHFPCRYGHRGVRLHSSAACTQILVMREWALESWVPRSKFKHCDIINTDPVGCKRKTRKLCVLIGNGLPGGPLAEKREGQNNVFRKLPFL